MLVSAVAQAVLTIVERSVTCSKTWLEPHPLGNVPLNKLKLTFRTTKLDAFGTIADIVPDKTGPMVVIDRIEGARVGMVPLR